MGKKMQHLFGLALGLALVIWGLALVPLAHDPHPWIMVAVGAWVAREKAALLGIGE